MRRELNNPLRERTKTLFLHRRPKRNTFGIVSSKVCITYSSCSLPFSRGRSTGYSDRLHDFSVTIPRCYKDVYVKSFFPGIARPWNSLPIKCFPLTYNLNGFKSRTDRHLLTVGSLYRDFLYALNFLCFFL